MAHDPENHPTIRKQLKGSSIVLNIGDPRALVLSDDTNGKAVILLPSLLIQSRSKFDKLKTLLRQAASGSKQPVDESVFIGALFTVRGPNVKVGSLEMNYEELVHFEAVCESLKGLFLKQFQCYRSHLPDCYKDMIRANYLFLCANLRFAVIVDDLIAHQLLPSDMISLDRLLLTT